MSDLAPGGFSHQELVPALMRRYLVFFLPWVFRALHPAEPPLRMRWYLWAMCYAFQCVALGRVTRLVINVPPRNLKSITSVAFTAWMLGNNPRLKFMLVTYAKELNKEHIENLRRVMAHPVYRELFPHTRLVKGGKGSIIRTTLGGGCRSVAVGGATTGFGADIILIDDAMNAQDIVSEAKRAQLERFYSGTILTRLNNKRRGIIISIQQRLGEDDLPARLIESGAEHLNLPAYDDEERVYDIGFGRIYRRPIGELLRPHDEGRAVLRRLRREMGPHAFATQYLGQPAALEGQIIPIGKFQRFNLEDYARRDFEKVVQSWDIASSEDSRADCSVCLTFGLLRKSWYLLHALRFREQLPKVRGRLIAHGDLWHADKVLIEDAGCGTHLWQDLVEMNQAHGVYRVRPDRDKITRMVGQLGMIEDGRIFIPSMAPWLDGLIREWRSFPSARHDDQVDALSQFLIWVKTHAKWVRTTYDPETGRPLHIERPLRNRRHRR